ncbi:unnamed protein product [Spodoptera littoralis]|uniref:F-box domain-containing protein n=1 Tax=Spodoptera littoralis TaxID=7109 RepID=A0A9P0N2U8_SPOLI|nr:unnamed protein product [Spodoptera littoralis]CAH1640417.1 unnamed protein product [Spodoptera littoralis]
MDETIFPNEIWLEIFKNIDRPQLMELRLVCHHFYDLIEHLLNRDPAWIQLTRATILYECLEMTMQRAYPYELVSHWKDIHDPILWRGTYLSYKKWQKVLVNSYKKDTIDATASYGNISCMCTFDKYIAIAFDTGLIANYSIDDLSKPFYVANHGIDIMQVEFWYSDGNVMVVSLGDDCCLKFWDLQNRNEVSSGSYFANSISFGECRHFCITDMGGILTSYERVDNHVIPGTTLDLVLSENQHLIAHVVDGKYMTAMVWEEGGTVQFLGEVGIEGGKLIKFECFLVKDWNRLPKSLGASLQRLTMPTAIFFFGIGENCIGSTNYYEDVWHEYKLEHYFGCNVKSIALHAQILMFGLEDGSIHLLHIPHYGHVRKLKKRIKQSKKIQVDTQPIVDITILEVDKKPCIVAVTNQKVHLIHFF